MRVSTFNTIYELARHMQRDYRISEWDIGCFIRTIDKNAKPLVEKGLASYTELDILLVQPDSGKDFFNIYLAGKKEQVDINVNGTTIQIVPKTMSLFA